MKKINNKGFTLVELLAVIIILAIVVGITIPAIMSTTESAKLKALQTASQTSADWIERQYQLWTIYKADPGINASLKTDYFEKKTYEIELTGKDSIIEAAGIKPANVKKMWVYINESTGRACAVIIGAGDYPGACKTGGSCSDYTSKLSGISSSNGLTGDDACTAVQTNS